ncbi:MAG: 50S ribosomal protein L1 [Chlamydiota bacterium]
MTRKTKRAQEIEKIVGNVETFTIEKALDILLKCPKLKFDQSVELSIKLGVDPKKADQQVRGTVSLPHGTGKKMVILVFAKGDKVKEALDAGADYAGHDDLLEKVKEGWTEFTSVISTPDMMREVGKLGKVLGPRGLMPTPKAGTVTNDIAKAIKELKAGKVEFKVDKNGVVNSVVGKLSFQMDKLSENVKMLIQAIQRAKPPASKGIYLQSCYLSSTMGPGLKIEVQSE